MADISITKYKTKVTKPTASPSNPGYPTSDPIDPVNPPASGAGGGGVNTFLQLTDTPASYTGQAGLFPRVNSGETGLGFFNPLSLPLTGYTVGSNTALAATDTILQAFGKVQGQINAKIGGTIASGQVAFGTGTGTIGGDSGLTWDNVNKRLVITNTSAHSIFRNSGRLAISRPDNLSIESVSFGGGNDEITVRSLGKIIHSGTVFTLQNNASGGIININSASLGIQTPSPTNTLDVNGTARIRTLSNATGDFVTASATGVLQKRTASETLADIGAIGGTIASGQVAFGTGTATIGGDSALTWDNTTKNLSITTPNTSALRPINLNFLNGNATIGNTVTSYVYYYLKSTSAIGAGSFQVDNNSTGQLLFSMYGTNENGTLFGNNRSNFSTIVNASGSGLMIGAVSASPLIFGTNNLERARFLSTGEFGINTTSPTNTLDVNGTARIRTLSNATGDFVTTSATGVLQKRTAAEVVSDLGISGGLWTATGSDIYRNSKVLVGATSFTDTGAKFEVSGRVSQVGLNTSTYFGYEAGLNDDLTANLNCGFGHFALKNVTSGLANNAFGYRALENVTTGVLNDGFGGDVLRSTTTGSYNAAFGTNALDDNTTGSFNSAFGILALTLNTTGQYNVSIGLQSSALGTTASFNTIVGARAFESNVLGSNNVAIGYFSAGSNTRADNSIFVGYNTRPAGNSQTNQIVIGYNIAGLGSNTTVIGDTNVTDNYIRGNFNIQDAKNFVFQTTTGTKIGTATSQKLAFWNATPIVQPTTAVTGATLVGGGGTTITDTDTFDGYTLAQIVKALRNIGLLA